MDTISIKLNFSSLLKISIEEMENIKRKLNSLRSEFGYRYIDVLEFNYKGYIIKISYPRYFKDTNAFLITKTSECFEVQEYFIQQLINLGIFEFFSHIELIRVDIPFTYYMKEEESFYQYKNVFKSFAYIYQEQERNASPKAILDIITENQETLYYANTKVIANYNSRIMIYNQDLNIYNKCQDEELYRKIYEDFPDLKKRIRFEVSKRIQREAIKINDFPTFNIIGNYFPKFKSYLLKKLINPEILYYIRKPEINYLREILLSKRHSRYFTYEAFLLENISHIWDYAIIKSALMTSISNVKTRENATTAIRKILKNYEKRRGIFILNVSCIIDEMYEYFLKLNLEE